MRWVGLLLGLSACAQGAGDPWGILEPSLTVAFDPPPERLDASGALLTASGYALSFRRFAVRLDGLETRFGAGEVLSFDPASPPPGYSLCHGGHCHADDGRLVDYEDIAAELAGGATGSTLRLAATDAEVPVGRAPTPVSLEACPEEGCVAERGRIVGFSVTITALVLSFDAVDRTVPPRFPGGLAVDGVAPLGGSVATAASIPIAPGAPLVHDLRAHLRLLPGLFDAVDFAGIHDASPAVRTATLAEALARALADEAALSIDTDEENE